MVKPEILHLSWSNICDNICARKLSRFELVVRRAVQMRPFYADYPKLAACVHARDKAATLSTSSFSSGICTAPAAAGGRTSFQALPLPKKLQLDLNEDPSESKSR